MRLTADQVHYGWDNSIDPVLTVAGGDEVELELLDASAGQLHRHSPASDIAALDFGAVNPVTGPIAVVGAEPGDSIRVSILELSTGDWGWSAIIPGFGLLADEFPDAELVISAVSATQVVLPFGIRIPALPMIGTIGVALPEPGLHSVVPPRRFGGNLDIRHLTAGSSITLPVGVPGGLLSIGDAHAAMGDGEVCGTGIEVDARARVRIEVLKGREVPAPVLLTDPACHRSGPALATTGIAPDLMEATRSAVRHMVDEIVLRTGLSPTQAYLTCSVAGDLKISEVVDMPNWVVSMHVSLALLEG